MERCPRVPAFLFDGAIYASEAAVKIHKRSSVSLPSPLWNCATRCEGQTALAKMKTENAKILYRCGEEDRLYVYVLATRITLTVR